MLAQAKAHIPVVFDDLRHSMMTLGSLFSGSGSFELAGLLNGIVPIWASEVEPYPIAVTTSRFPQLVASRERHQGFMEIMVVPVV